MHAVTWMPAYIGIGSNLDDPRTRVRDAFEALAGLPQTQVVLTSSIYRSQPLGPIAQPDFYNAAAGLLTQLEPLTLLRQLKQLEDRLGREQPEVRWGPRKIDFDLLLYGALILRSDELVLPHPGLIERAFALVPLADIAPQVRIPGGTLVSRHAARVDRCGLQMASAAQRAP